MRGRPPKLFVNINDRIGLWTVIGDREASGHTPTYLCRCDCGTERRVGVTDLVRGSSRSCGCMTVAAARTRATHGDSRRDSPHFTLYNTWQGMKTRCLNPNVECYPRYGGRGISVCGEWRSSYTAFKEWSLANGWTPELELDRRDNDADYSPANCRWVSHTANMANSAPARRITAWGETKSVTEWSQDPRCVVSRRVLSGRLTHQTGTAEEAISVRFFKPGPRPR